MNARKGREKGTLVRMDHVMLCVLIMFLSSVFSDALTASDLAYEETAPPRVG